MGTASFSIAKYGKNYKGLRAEYVDGGFHTTSTSASDLTDGAAGGGSAINAVKGDILTITVDEAARVQFGGVAATANAGHIIFASTPTDLEVSDSGAISIIDVA